MPNRIASVKFARLWLLSGQGMTRGGIGFVLVLFFMAFAGEARAWTPFGTVERISRMEDVALKTPAGDPLYLGHKTSTVYFIGGVFVRDDGYVLGLQSKPRHYVDMPPAAMLADFQKSGQLPNPLPPYRLTIGDYLRGFSLWIVVGPLIGVYLYFHFATRRRRRPAARH